jgi:2,3-dihydroxybiphenyl 1,2-dioxygenase
MGYLVVGSRKIAEWKDFATNAIGLHLAFDSPSELAFRMDGHARRLIVLDDASEDVMAVGWQLDSDAELQVVLKRLANRGVSVEVITDGRAASRGVASLHCFVGPKGLQIELFTAPILDESPLNMLCSGFRTGAGGMGHISLMSREPTRCVAFWQELFDARISDTISLAVGNRTVLDVDFLRVNERHHSVAIAGTRGRGIDMFRTCLNHVNIEAATVDDLSFAHERCAQSGCKITRGVGRHPNDRELSFYVMTPSGFELEIGWDALTVDESCWQEGISYPNMSTWGHHTPGRFSTELGFSHLVQIVRSLGGKEYLPW